MVAVEPHDRAIGRFGDEVIAAQIVAVPPARFDALGAVLQDPRRLLQPMLQRLSFVDEPQRAWSIGPWHRIARFFARRSAGRRNRGKALSIALLRPIFGVGS